MVCKCEREAVLMVMQVIGGAMTCVYELENALKRLCRPLLPHQITLLCARHMRVLDIRFGAGSISVESIQESNWKSMSAVMLYGHFS